MPKPNDVPKPGDVWTGELIRGRLVIAVRAAATLTRPDGGSGFPDRVSFVAPAGSVAVGDTVMLVTAYARSLLIHVDQPASRVPSADDEGLEVDSFDARLVRFGLNVHPARPPRRMTREEMLALMKSGYLGGRLRGDDEDSSPQT